MTAGGFVRAEATEDAIPAVYRFVPGAPDAGN
jgi:hypothetical protein